VFCNPAIKWKKVLEKADKIGCHYIATGHYARIRNENGRWFVSRASDETKDQTYVLWKLTQDQLQRTLFPLGELKKSVIKEMAEARGFTRLAKKKESQEVCFIPDNDYRSFLNKRVPGLSERVEGGLFVDKHGKTLGKHHGYPFYTIGQRKGLAIALGKPAYVLHIDPRGNTITLGEKTDLASLDMTVSNWIGQKFETLSRGQILDVKVRYNTPAVACTVVETTGSKILIRFHEPVSAITPGQSAVFYDGNDLAGGAIILSE
jgi:tRNA-specific 2-thiouridylase